MFMLFIETVVWFWDFFDIIIFIMINIHWCTITFLLFFSTDRLCFMWLSNTCSFKKHLVFMGKWKKYNHRHKCGRSNKKVIFQLNFYPQSLKSYIFLHLHYSYNFLEVTVLISKMNYTLIILWFWKVITVIIVWKCLYVPLTY